MNHLEEWKKIKERYEKGTQSKEIKYRIERIKSLIESEETRQKEMNHFQ